MKERSTDETIDDRLDDAVQDLGLRFDGVLDRSLVFVPVYGAQDLDTDALLDKIVERLQSHSFMEELTEIDSIQIMGR